MDADGKGTTNTFHPDGQVATVQTKTDGMTLQYRYDIFENMVGIRAGDYEKRYNYDPEGRLLSESDCYGTQKICTYDALGRLQTETDAAGGVTHYTYNAFGEIASQRLPGDETVPELEVSNIYDRAGRLAECSDSAGNRTSYTYDSLGNVLTQTVYDTQTGEAHTVSYTYDANGNCTSMTDAMDIYTEYHYDALGRKTSEAVYVNGRGQTPKVMAWEYDADGNNTLVRDYLGNEVRAEYDSHGRLTAQYDALGCLVAAYSYDDCDRQVSSTDALGNESIYAYDADGNTIKVTAPDGAVTTATYDYARNILSQTDPKGNRTLYTYDGRNRLVAVEDALGGVYQYTYDNADNQISQTDPAGKSITYTYNVRGDLAMRQYGGEETIEAYRYAADGLLLEKTDRNGATTSYTYDGFGRLAVEQAGEDQKTYTYDIDGNLLTASDHGVATIRTYDAEGRVTSKAVDGIGVVTYTYDLDMVGGEVSERATYPDGTTTMTTYDNVGRICQVSSSDGTSVSESYYANGSRRATTYGDGSRQEYTYDAAGRITKLIHRDAAGDETGRYSYTYDANGNLTCESGSTGETYYTYDALDRLISVVEPEGKVTEYTYDLSGNRATKTERLGGKETYTVYTYDASNLLIRQGCSDGTVVLYTYDANGNLTAEETAKESGEAAGTAVEGDAPADGTVGDTTLPIELDNIPVTDGIVEIVTGSAVRGTLDAVTVSAIWENLGAFPAAGAETVTDSAIGETDTDFLVVAQETVSGSAIRLYTYDNFNRLISYQSGITSAIYTYNAEDYRTTKQVISPDGEAYTQYFYEGGHVVLETDATGNATAHNTYSINLASRTAGEEGYYYFYNAHGDVVKLSGTKNGTEVKYHYDAFGTLASVEGDADNSITYAGYQYDAESGLYYLNARYYDSITARFLTEDTYGGRADDPLSLNRYTYCANNPLRYADPSGHFALGAVAGAFLGAAIGGVVEYINQKYIEKRKEISWKGIFYEAGIGLIGGLFGGTGKKLAGGVKLTGKVLLKKVGTAGIREALWGGLEDAGRQIIVEGRWGKDYAIGQTLEAMAVAGVGGVFGATADFIADYRKNAKVKYVPKQVEVERVSYYHCNHMPICISYCPTSKKTVVKTKEWRMVKVVEYSGSDRTWADYLGDYAEGQTVGKTQGNTTGSKKLNLQFFAENTGGKKTTAKSTFWGRMHKDKNGVAFDTPISLKQALKELDASGLKPGQSELHISQLNKALDGIQNHYDWKTAESWIYFNGSVFG